MHNERLQSVWIFIKLLARNYRDDNCQTTAAALTYQTLFAVVPMLTIVFFLFSSFKAFAGMGDMLQSFLFENLLPESVSTIEGYLREFSAQAKNLGGPSIILLVVTAFLMMFTVERSFNLIWRVHEPRHGFQRLLMYWAVLTLGPFLLVLSIATTTYVLSLPYISDVSESVGLLPLLPTFLNLAFFTLAYASVPNCYVPIRHAVLGALLVSLMFEVLQQLFGVLMAQTEFEVIYGTFAAVPIFLMWIYLFWTIVLFGAEFTKGIGLYDSEKSELIEPPLLQLMLVLEEFFRCHQSGQLVTEKNIMKLSKRVDMQQWNGHKSRLLQLGLIRPIENGGLILARDLAEVTVWDLYQKLPWPMPGGFRNAEEGWQSRLNEHLSTLDRQAGQDLQIDIEGLFRKS